MTQPHRVRRAGRPIDARVRPPGSKSGTIRALVAAALANGRSHLYGALRADDSAAMVRTLRSFGVAVDDRSEPWAVDGTGGHLRAPGEGLNVSESGLTARIALVLAALAEGTTVVDGGGRLRERPIASLVEALAEQGVDITTTSGFLPATVSGQGGLWGGQIRVDCARSSQFATALMLAAPLTTEPASLHLEGLEGSAGYLTVTAEIMEAFGATVSPTFTGYDIANHGYQPRDHVLEPDASAAVYPMVAAAITGGRVEIPGLRLSSAQPDVFIGQCLSKMGCRVGDDDSGLYVNAKGVDLAPIDVDMSDAPDGALALAIACLFAQGESRLRGLFSLRYKESDRLAALTKELSGLGAEVVVEDEGLIIRPGDPRGTTISSHGDHRIAMAGALVGLAVEGISVSDPDVVNKTWPGYWETLDGLTDDPSPAQPA